MTNDQTGLKARLRHEMRARRDAFVAGGPPPLRSLPPLDALLRPGAIVATYVAIGSEADPMPLLEAARAGGCRTALPHITRRDEPMRFLAWQPGDALHPGPFGLRQPSADAPELVPDIVLTPLLAFDAALNRLGQGAGYYDRAFARLTGVTRIGIAWSVQQADSVPIEAWDMPLHAVLTEREWITPK
jgi:5-formyltetrahydrofolate cyclo-ligase